MKYDLHVHSTYSDGDYSPIELLELYRGKLDGFALTDHDTIDGVVQCMEEAESKNIKLIPGIEFSCVYKDKDVHILGLNLDISNKKLISTTDFLKRSRVDRAKKIIELLKRDGIYLNETKLLKNNRIGRSHIAMELVDKGFARNISEAFSLYLKRGSRYYVEKDSLTIMEAIDIIDKAGGKSILAHPGEIENLEEVLNICLDYNIDGIEVIHPRNNKKIKEEMMDFALKHQLIFTGGSDFHRRLNDIGRYYIDFEQ